MKTTHDLKRVFTWLTRTGMGPKFGSRPIGWYQLHQCHAIAVLDETFGVGAELCVRKGVVYGFGAPGCIAVSEVFRRADERARK